MDKTQKGKELRVALNQSASGAYEIMIARLKKEMPTVKIQASSFVSFLVADFLDSHFEKDKAVLIAEFFDSDAFHEVERKKAKGKENYEELMAEALERAKRIKSKRRRKSQQIVETLPPTKGLVADI
jgi:hypothetical protein